MTEVYIGLGSNLGDKLGHLHQALRQLGELANDSLQACSSFYGSAAWGETEQADFVNAVVRIETSLEPLELLDTLQAIEHRLGRRRIQHWGPRIIDLDILLYGGQLIRHPRLRVPHPYLHQRVFVLLPLLELDPGIIIPGVGSGRLCLSGLADQQVWRLPQQWQPQE